MKLRHDLKGKQFGRWRVLRRDPIKKDRPFWVCLCECGKQRSISSGDLIAGHSQGCKSCAIGGRSATHGLSRSKRYGLYHSAFQRAKQDGVLFKITPVDVPEIPSICPLLEIPLSTTNTRCGPNSPTLDRVVPALGYIKNNIWIISHKANTIKSNASVDELLLLVKNFTSMQIEKLKLELDTIREQ